MFCFCHAHGRSNDIIVRHADKNPWQQSFGVFGDFEFIKAPLESGKCSGSLGFFFCYSCSQTAGSGNISSFDSFLYKSPRAGRHTKKPHVVPLASCFHPCSHVSQACSSKRKWFVMMFELMCSSKKNWNWWGLNGSIVRRLALSIEDKWVQHV